MSTDTDTTTNADTNTPLPFAGRKAEDVPGHWLLARLGKKVLRPGGRALTEKLVAAAQPKGSDVVELAPGLGLTARLILDSAPRSYTGVEADEAASAIAAGAVGERGTVVVGDAKATGLHDGCADMVINEAMLTMNTDRAKGQIIAEVVRILRPGGRYAIHELALMPDDIAEEIATEVRLSLARSIKVNARPLTIAEWRALLEEAGLVVETVETAPMSLLKVRRVIADEGILGTLKIGVNYLRDAEARKRVTGMWRTFQKHQKSIIAVAIVAHKPTLS